MAKKSAKGLHLRSDGLYEKSKMRNGKRKVFRSRDPDEVWKMYWAYEVEIQDGPDFKTVADDWKSEHFPTLTSNAQKGYAAAYKRAVEEFGDETVKEIKPKRISLYIKSFSKGRAQKTVTNQLMVIRLILEHACEQGYIDINPAVHVKVPKGLAKEPRRFPTDEEISIVKKSLDKTFGLFFYLVLYSGCRRGEALALKWGDIDFDKKEVHITKSVYYTPEPTIKKPKSDAGNRSVVLLDRLAAVLLPLKGPGDVLLFSNNGNYHNNSAVDKLMQKYYNETGIHVTPHCLRHGFATMLFEAGIDVKTAQYFLGHAQASTTLDIYTHLREQQKIKAAKSLNKFDLKT